MVCAHPDDESLDALLRKSDDRDVDVDFLAEAVPMLAQALVEADL